MSMPPFSPLLRSRAGTSSSDKENVAPVPSVFGPGPKKHVLVTDTSNKENIPPVILNAVTLNPGIYIDQDARMCAQPTSPSNLSLEALSLVDRPTQPLMVLSTQTIVQNTRASMMVLHKAIFADTHPTLPRTSILIAYARGSLIQPVSHHALCNESRILAKMLDGPSLLPQQTRCLRLRGDFPPAIRALLSYVETGAYTLDPATRAAHPALTTLDLHVHAYLVGRKYEVPRLCEYAVAQYAELAGRILSFDFPSDIGGPASALLGPRDGSSAGLVERFLDSVVLVWKNTCEVDGELREVVLELVKVHIRMLVGVEYFGTLMGELGGLGDDVLGSLGEDGFEVVGVRVGRGDGLCFV